MKKEFTFKKQMYCLRIISKSINENQSNKINLFNKIIKIKFKDRKEIIDVISNNLKREDYYSYLVPTYFSSDLNLINEYGKMQDLIKKDRLFEENLKLLVKNKTEEEFKILKTDLRKDLHNLCQLGTNIIVDIREKLLR